MSYCFSSVKEAHEVGWKFHGLIKNNKGWKINVWENMGWHLSLDKGPISVHYSPLSNTFTAYLSADHSHGDSGFWHESYYHKDINKVIAHKLKVAKAFVKRCADVIAEVER
jgi:hypothetical protein